MMNINLTFLGTFLQTKIQHNSWIFFVTLKQLKKYLKDQK